MVLVDACCPGFVPIPVLVSCSVLVLYELRDFVQFHFELYQFTSLSFNLHNSNDADIYLRLQNVFFQSGVPRLVSDILP